MNKKIPPRRDNHKRFSVVRKMFYAFPYHKKITTFKIKDLKFDEKGLIPAIIQDYKTNEVTMIAYMNLESLKRTIKGGKTCFWSRSRQEFWTKGLSSGHYQYVKSISYDCDMDALLIKVRQVGAACHTGNRTCFYRRINI